MLNKEIPKLGVRMSRSEEGSSITVIYEGKSYDATDQHPNFDEIVAGAIADDPSVIELFDIAETIGNRLRLSERFSTGSGRLYFDGDELSGDLADGILHLIHEKEDPQVLVNFAERLMTNPDKSSRNQLYTWLRGQKFTMTPEGKLIMYKGVNDTGKYDDGKRRYLSLNGGVAIINGVYHEAGPVPQHVGDIIEIPRSMVVNDPHNACSVGLHAATFSFAKGFASTTLEVEIDPRDVVSVPTHANFQKVRVSRYKILGIVTTPRTESVRREQPKVSAAGSTAGPLVGTKSKTALRAPNPKQLAQAKRELAAVRHPSVAMFTEFKQRAKRQKMGLRRFCERHGLRLISGTGQSREDWAIDEKK